MVSGVSKTSKPLRGGGAAAGVGGSLSLYRKKRDFSKTPEPGGAIVPDRGDWLRFVVQKHAARRLHYDFRLELGGVFKSWAVARGPSLDPGQKRLAIHVEDHPIDYGDFEGIIPKGEYGGGTVMIWDRGIWRPDGNPAKAYAKGDLAFELDGEKLKGRWHLIRMKARPGAKKEQWLLFKSGDQFAHQASKGDVLENEPDSVATRRSMAEIGEDKAAVWSSRGGLILGTLTPASKRSRRPKGSEKRSDAGIDPSSLKGAKKAPFPGFAEPCLALLVDEPPEGDGWLHEIKLDGYRLIAFVEKRRVRLLTRRGQDWTDRFRGIAKALEELPVKSAILDGEAVVEDRNGVPGFSALQEALAEHRAGTAAIFCAFDLLYYNGYDLRNAALGDRKSALEPLLSTGRDPHLCYSEHLTGNCQAIFEHACRLGLEGIVSKRRDAPYRPGRHGEWTKAKCTNREEFVIGGYTLSKASRHAVGALALGYYENGGLIYAGRTGTGFTQKLSRALYQSLQELRSSRSPFANALTSAERRGLIFAEPQRVAEVEFRGWTPDRRLRHAAFKGLREDKPAEEVQLEMPREKKRLAQTPEPPRKTMPAKAGTASRAVSKGGVVEFSGINLTHPGRVLWQDQGLTKLGLAEYYAEIADRILPHIVRRPLALLRCPEGSEGECFFQKHAFPGLTGAVEIVQVPDKGGTAEAIVIHDLAGLINLVQANVLEIHPWGARIEDVEHPDTLIFDLDPGEGVEWSAIAGGANEIRQRLRDTGLESFVKTTGGKGLHVVVPLEPSVDWDALKDFARGIALAMEAGDPSRYISTMSKKARSGKIFVDYLRNARGATAVAPYSARARAGAPVSTPVRWEELGPDLTAGRFNVGNIPRRLAGLNSDPWEGYFSSPQPIAEAVSKAKPAKKQLRR
jgi:bifunctional non-homologous end joining protein LigD